MADKWMDDRDRDWRDREARREPYTRDERRPDQMGGADRSGEDRTFNGGPERGGFGEPGGYQRQDRVFGERETGASYSRGVGGPVSGAPQGGYGRSQPAFGAQDYTRYGGADRPASAPQAPRDFAPRRDFDAGYQTRCPQRPASGGTGGYDYERGYGDGPQGGRYGQLDGPADFLQRAGERLSSWFSGEPRRDEPGEPAPHHFREDSGRETREIPERGHRGLGPKGYKRPDERISDEVHERLTDDTWLDARNVGVSVSGGEVTLSGTVESREAKHRAERLVEEITGVDHVQNNLRVDKGGFLTRAGSGFGDSVLEAQTREGDTTAPIAPKKSN